MTGMDDKLLLEAIVAVDEAGAIGCRGRLLCHLPLDLKHFKELTMGHAIVMGRKTLESFPRGPLPGRQNVVLTRNKDYAPEGVTVVHTVDSALRAVVMPGPAFVIGGAQVYRAMLPLVTTLHLTVIHHTFKEADTFFPPIAPQDWEVVAEERHETDERHPYPFTFKTLKLRP